jgi:anti-anti-sigma factor
MNIQRKESEGETIFIVMDEMVAQNVNTLTDEINHFIKNDDGNAIIDLSHVRKIDSMSISALIRLKNALAEHGRTLQLSNPNETVFRVLELSGLEKYLLE